MSQSWLWHPHVCLTSLSPELAISLCSLWQKGFCDGLQLGSADNSLTSGSSHLPGFLAPTWQTAPWDIVTLLHNHRQAKSGLSDDLYRQAVGAARFGDAIKTREFLSKCGSLSDGCLIVDEDAPVYPSAIRIRGSRNDVQNINLFRLKALAESVDPKPESCYSQCQFRAGLHIPVGSAAWHSTKEDLLNGRPENLLLVRGVL